MKPLIREPTIIDLIFGAVLLFAMVSFMVAMAICRHRIDAWALDENGGKAKRRITFISCRRLRS
jgi:hypothetical protein